MATHVNIADADRHLTELIALAKQGEEVVIEDEDRTPIKLVVVKPKKQRVFGQHEGRGWIADNFNDPLSEDFWFGGTP
jgi:antitoxin (DNA-binding transcriptional repressor) of toxin-antitoxin stability system